MKRRIAKILILILALSALPTVSACSAGAGRIQFASDIADGETVTEWIYNFSAAAAYGGRPIPIAVSVNGVMIEGNGDYAARLTDGANAVKLYAAVDGEFAEKEYTVNCNAGFRFFTDIDSLTVDTGVLKFSARATYKGMACSSYAIGNGGLLEADAWGFYNLNLRTGVTNEISLNGIGGGETGRREYEIDFGEFTVINNLINIDIVPKHLVPESGRYYHTVFPDFSFFAMGLYGAENCDVRVMFNDVPVGESAPRNYAITLKPGVNSVAVRAIYGSMSHLRKYTVVYNDKEIDIKTSIEEGKTNVGSRMVFSVEARGSYGEVIGNEKEKLDEDEVYLGGIIVHGGYGESGYNVRAPLFWDETSRQAYQINLTAVMANANVAPAHDDIYGGVKIRIAVTDMFYRTVYLIREIQYHYVQNGSPIGRACFTLEARALDTGFLEKPEMIVLNEGDTAASVLQRALQARGYKADYVNNESTRGVRLWAVQRADINGGAWLGRLSSVAQAPDWNFFLNGRPGSGLDSCYPLNGDVFRMQYSINAGADVFGIDELIRLLAVVYSDGLAVGNENAYTAALAVGGMRDPSADAVKNAIAALRGEYEL
ncbi:MAG: hypothetical protein LBL66_00760 [Clostridiales bacterium]|jgi:hypothetical protein|nr:hypothetical protein [Clostridiales bacterium]